MEPFQRKCQWLPEFHLVPTVQPRILLKCMEHLHHPGKEKDRDGLDMLQTDIGTREV